MALETPLEPAHISQCELILDDVTKEYTQQIRKLVFGDLEKQWGDIGSPFQRWYRTVALLPSNGRSRSIAWKDGKPFAPESLFFRTIDTKRLLPMHLADFRIQFYAHKSHWEHLDGNGKRNGWKEFTLSGIMHELLLLRNMHDCGGGDIPIIVTNWTGDFTNAAMEYWSELSKGEWSEEEKQRKYSECASRSCRNNRPCFAQADLLLRALLSDPAVGYVPPFIVIIPSQKFPGPRARALFTDPSNRPPRSLTHNWPKSCGAPQCDNADCGSFDLDACRSLKPGSAMVRESPWPGKRVLCNVWGCETRHSPEEGTILQRCQRCKEALYCDRGHQLLDWGQHRNVCEREP